MQGFKILFDGSIKNIFSIYELRMCVLELNKTRVEIAHARIHTQRHMNNAWSEMVFSTPCLALYCSLLPWLIQTIWDNSSPTTDQPCRLIITLLLLIIHFYDYEQSNAPPSTVY